MLTASQVEIVAFVGDGDIVCRDCVVREFGEMAVAHVENGLDDHIPGTELTPLIRFELDQIVSEDAAEYANEEVGRTPPHDGPRTELADVQLDENAGFWRAWDEVYQRIADLGYPCGDCGEGIS